VLTSIKLTLTLAAMKPAKFTLQHSQAFLKAARSYA
jgi:hypothetical protein